MNRLFGLSIPGNSATDILECIPDHRLEIDYRVERLDHLETCEALLKCWNQCLGRKHSICVFLLQLLKLEKKRNKIESPHLLTI